VTFVTVTFAMFLSFVESSRRLEASSTFLQARFLEEIAPDLDRDGPMARGPAAERLERLAVAKALLLVDPDERQVVAGPQDLLYPDELTAIVAGGAMGDSTAFDSPSSFAWQRLPDRGLVLVAVNTRSTIASSGSDVWIAFALMLALTGAVSFALSRSLSRDIGATTRELRDEVERTASGDLRPGRILESEDELGGLARSFEGMTSSLRSTVGRVSTTADRVEVTAAELSAVSKGVLEGAVGQGRGVKQAASLMEAVDGRVEGIATSAQELNTLVEESSSSILEMGAASDELNDTAGVLSSKVDEVSSSIEQMVRSVRQVGSNTGALSEAAAETSSSMEEMASAMRQVDTTAEHAGKLSQRVVESAEGGQEKVRQTIEGMESIRSATEAAEQVIRGLGERTVEIGAILDVIDDVADETNLLALNAAIIAAQAGEHGRAFSVVADAFKELADRVLASTKEIGGLIRSVQDESKNAISAIEQGTVSVASGVRLSMEAGSSLEEITELSRDSGVRIQEIVQAVREQTKAASHVVSLMERVSGGVEAIQSATGEQDRGNEVVYRSSMAMREVAQQLRGTTEEQARGGARIRQSIDGVRDAVESINAALQAQASSNRELASFLEQVSERASSNEESARKMEESTRALTRESETLRDDVSRFEL
jgi:methyl-accepting chemotaxis protein